MKLEPLNDYTSHINIRGKIVGQFYLETRNICLTSSVSEADLDALKKLTGESVNVFGPPSVKRPE